MTNIEMKEETQGHATSSGVLNDRVMVLGLEAKLSVGNASSEGGFSRADELRHFEIRRTMIVHEDGQINARLNMLIVANGVLFAATTLAFGLKSSPSLIQLVLVLIFGALGIMVTGAFDGAIEAAKCEQDKVIGRTDENAKNVTPDELERLSNTFPFSKQNKENLTKALQATGNEKSGGRSIIRRTHMIIYAT